MMVMVMMVMVMVMVMMILLMLMLLLMINAAPISNVAEQLRPTRLLRLSHHRDGRRQR